MTCGAALALLLAVVMQTRAASVSIAANAVTESDLAAIRQVFQRNLDEGSDTASVYYALSGLKLLDSPMPKNTAPLCELAKKSVDLTKPETVFFSSGVSSRLGCSVDTKGVEEALRKVVENEPKAESLFAVIGALKNLKLKVDESRMLSALKAAVKKDDSVASLAYAFHACAQLSSVDIKPFVDRIEDVVAQADEIDGMFLQFDGGLSATANAIGGILMLAEKTETAPMSKDEAVKFANYLMSRKGVRLVRPAYHLIRALTLFSKTKHFQPVVIGLGSPIAVETQQPAVRVKVTDLFGKTLPGHVSVVMDSATHVATSGLVVNKKQMSPVSGEPSMYEVNFLEERRERGFYKLKVSISSDVIKNLMGTERELSVKVLAQVAIESVGVSVLDRDQNFGTNEIKVQYPNKIPTQLECDHHQKLVMRFSLKDKSTGKAINVHQAFVVFKHEKGRQYATFVAEPDASAKQPGYKFDVDFLKNAKDFGFQSGKYKMSLVIGDAVIANSVDWNLAELSIKFPAQETVPPSVTDAPLREKLPEIKHLFREKEKSPPQILSDAFSIAVLVPLLILFVAWLKLGVNLSNFSMSLPTLGFHVGLAGIFGLYGLFWLKLNMFQTLKYLSGLALFTFLCGNAMLRAKANRRTA